MCLATPIKIKKIDGQIAIVGDENHDHEVNLNLIKDAKIGDYVLVHAGMAINKVSEKEVEKIEKMIKEIEH